MNLQRIGFTAGLLSVAAIWTLLIINVAQNPVATARASFEYEMVQLPPLDFSTGGDETPEADLWRETVAGRQPLWQPLTQPKAQIAPPPNLAQMLAGVEPSRNQMGSGDTLKVQIRVDGGKDWFVRGQQIKGCTIKEIQPDGVIFSVIQNAKEFVIKIPRR